MKTLISRLINAPIAAGTLTIGNIVRTLYVGVNVVGRESGDPIRNRERAEQWTQEHCSAVSVSTLLIIDSSVSSKHAIIYTEEGGLCFLKDLGLRNKTTLNRGGIDIRLLPGDRHGLSSGVVLQLRATSCTIRLNAPPATELPADGTQQGTPPAAQDGAPTQPQQPSLLPPATPPKQQQPVYTSQGSQRAAPTVGSQPPAPPAASPPASSGAAPPATAVAAENRADGRDGPPSRSPGSGGQQDILVIPRSRRWAS